MSKYVLDASAILASLQNEDGYKIVDAILHESAISTINLSEVLQKVKQKGITTKRIVEGLQTEGVEIIDYTIQQAEITADLWTITKPFGLSLGDRSCLSLAVLLNAVAITADKSWVNIPSIKVQVIR